MDQAGHGVVVAKRNLSVIEVSPCLVSKVQDNRPYIQFNILGRTVAALLDTGASVCVIGKDSMNLVKQLNLKIQPSKQIRSITTADGRTH